MITVTFLTGPYSFYIADDFLQQIKIVFLLCRNARKKYTEELQLPVYDASVICADKETADYFETTLKHTSNYKAAANWLTGPG